MQSTAVLVLAARGAVQYDAFLFANVGHDSEHPDTLEYVEQVAKPYAKQHGIALHELFRVPVKGRYKGRVETVYGRCMDDNRSIAIPARMSNGAPGNRACTNDFKIRVIAKWLREHGATKKQPAVTGLGISLDEMQRARTDSGIPIQTLEYPLIDLRMTRQDCINLIADEGIPVPPKSSCFFCPFHSRDEWKRLKNERPDLFDKAIELEDRINVKRGALGRDQVRLHSSGQPLAEAVAGNQPGLFDDEPACESGYCMV